MRTSHGLGSLASGLLALSSVARVSEARGCAAQGVLDGCLYTQGIVLNTCPYSDWACKCQAQMAIASCFNNCPGDPLRPAQDGQVLVFCNAARHAEEEKSASSVKPGPAASSKPGASAASTASKDREANAATKSANEDDIGSKLPDNSGSAGGSKWKKGTAFTGTSHQRKNAGSGDQQQVDSRRARAASPNNMFSASADTAAASTLQSSISLASLALGTAAWVMLAL
ncbi:hypothetical protein GQ54DRAFT_299306 [Martensiomyces pterosporus]|nr:hypothetical protein GQ54DRAFT_299306 [Martensiomyces pterosporus]